MCWGCTLLNGKYWRLEEEDMKNTMFGDVQYYARNIHLLRLVIVSDLYRGFEILFLASCIQHSLFSPSHSALVPWKAHNVIPYQKRGTSVTMREMKDNCRLVFFSWRQRLKRLAGIGWALPAFLEPACWWPLDDQEIDTHVWSPTQRPSLSLINKNNTAIMHQKFTHFLYQQTKQTVLG